MPNNQIKPPAADSDFAFAFWFITFIAINASIVTALVWGRVR
jgi:hypothetical protein